jgi:hypothetical protein
MSPISRALLAKSLVRMITGLKLDGLTSLRKRGSA